MTTEEAWRQYQLAERRLDRSKAANDPMATTIARSQANYWLDVWCSADTKDAAESRGLDGPTARIARVA